MSRSTRKPFYKDSNHWAKKCSAGKHRAMERIILTSHIPPEYMEFIPRKAVMNQWDVCDYRFYSPSYSHAYRK